MTDPRIVGQELPGQILDTVRKSQEAVVDAVKAWADSMADSIQSVVPPLPAAAHLTDKLPKPDELVSTAYDFAERLLATQREFADKVLQAAAPVLARKGGSAQD